MSKKSIKNIVEETLELFGGEQVRNAVLFHMNLRYKVKPEEALSKVEAFVEALKDIYGPFEGPIEKEICSRIASEYGIKYSGNSLVELAKEIKKEQKLQNV
ncbi:MAG: hypothetical protein ACP5LF_04755 [Nitrososphaeria archaeon]|nr:hypothetical protein [Conexivisphaerales archaeon]